MDKTIPADNIGAKTSAYILVAQPSVEAQQKIVQLLQEISTKLPGTIWPMPASALHFTLFEIIHPKEYAEDKDTLYKKNKNAYEDISAEVLSAFSPIEVTLDTIEASQHAIIVRGKDDGSFNEIRKQLVARLPIPAQTKSPPDIIHSSIARYRQEVDLAVVQNVIKELSFSYTMLVDEFKMLKNHTFPLLEYETLRTYTLRKS